MSTNNITNSKAAATAPPAKATSADELNKLLKITHPYHWLSIAGLVALALFTIVWSLVGSIPTRVQGLGQITSSEGLHAVIIRYQGQLQLLYAHLGDPIKEGQVIAKVSQPELDQELLQLRNQMDVLQEQYDFLKKNNTANLNIKDRSSEEQLSRIKTQIVNFDTKIKFLEQRVKEQEQLYKDGLITYDQFFKTQDDLAQAKTTRNQFNEDLLNVELGKHEYSLGNSVKEQDITNQMSVLNKKIKESEKEYAIQTNVLATASGTVTEVTANPGDFVRQGQSLFTIEETNDEASKNLDLFIPFNSNSVIKPGMEVQIEPFTMDHNLYGWLLGDVVSVNHYVASQALLISQLNNPDLVSLISKGGPVYQVVVKLRPDPNTICKYASTNRVGPPYPLQTGTLCNAYVEVKQKAPIDYIIPIFKNYFD